MASYKRFGVDRIELKLRYQDIAFTPFRVQVNKGSTEAGALKRC